MSRLSLSPTSSFVATRFRYLKIRAAGPDPVFWLGPDPDDVFEKARIRFLFLMDLIRNWFFFWEQGPDPYMDPIFFPLEVGANLGPVFSGGSDQD